ncbi:MAG: DNA primase [Leptospiraceae bacterium]|nr:DNA primase [Leptospiraceae bacterium]
MKNTDLKESILQAIPIESYIGRYVKLTKAGKYLKGLCPFHSEKTPSFTVTPEIGKYKCFGCGQSGDVFSFTMAMEGIGFREAMELLANYAGIDPGQSRQLSETQKKQEQLFALNQAAGVVYQQLLHTGAGLQYRQYLADRQIQERSASHFQLGAAPDAWDTLASRFSEQQELLLELGLLRRSPKDAQKVYDFFRDRIIFPILDYKGRTTGFGGRIVTSSPDRKDAKYINSQDSLVFQKGQLLYGLFENLKSIRQERQIWFTEGYLDVIGLWQAGFELACAPLGTAIRSSHLDLAARYADQVVAIFDGDPAGQKAALKFSALLLNFPRLQGRVLVLPPGMDAFDLSIQCSNAQLQQILAMQLDVDRFFVMETLFPGLGLQTMQAVRSDNPLEKAAAALAFYQDPKSAQVTGTQSGKRQALNRFYGSLADIGNPLDQKMLLDQAAAILALDGQELQREFLQQAHRDRSPEPMDRRPKEIKAQAHFGTGQALQSERSPEPGAGIFATPSAMGDWQRKIARMEQHLLLELVLDHRLAATAAQRLNQRAWIDISSEYLWRFLEGKLMQGEVWQAADLRLFDLPSANLEAFIRILADHQARYGPNAGDEELDEKLQRVQDMFFSLEELDIKKVMADLEARQHVADSVSRLAIVQERNQLIRQLDELKTARKQAPQR